jgi:hypothetical protein
MATGQAIDRLRRASAMQLNSGRDCRAREHTTCPHLLTDPVQAGFVDWTRSAGPSYWRMQLLPGHCGRSGAGTAHPREGPSDTKV